MAACRALGRAGYAVDVTRSRRYEEAAVSRHAAVSFRVPPLPLAVSDWCDAVRRIVHAQTYDVVIATTDAVVAALPFLDLPVPTTPRMEGRQVALIDKGQLADLCAQASVSYPRTDRPRTPAEDELVARGVGNPLVVKAARSASVSSDQVILLPGADVVRDPTSARRALGNIRRLGVDPIVQEYLEGQKLQAAIIRRAGHTSCRLAFGVVREFPPERGTETMLEALGTNTGTGERIVTMLERLADAAGYDGLLQAEFIWVPHTRQLSVIDINPRLWGSLTCAELLGYNMTERVVRDAMGLDPMPQPPDPAGRRYHHVSRELRWLLAKRRFPRGYLSTFSVRDVWDLPSLTDPFPDLLRLKRAVTR